MSFLRVNNLSRASFIYLFSFFSFYGFTQQSTLDSLNNLIKSEKHDSTRLRLICTIGEITDNQGTLELWDSVLKVSKKLRLIDCQARALRCMSILFENDDAGLERAMECLNESEKLFKQIKNKKEEAQSLYIKGHIYMQFGKSTDALECFKRCVDIREKTDDLDGTVEALGNVAFLYQRQGDIAKALDYNFKALKIAEKFNSKDLLGTLYNNIAHLYQGQDDPVKAIDYYEKSLKIFESTNNRKGIAFVFNNYSIIYQKTGDLNKAKDYSLKSLKIREGMGDYVGMANCYNSLGRIAELYDDKKLGNYDSALEHFEKALELRKKVEDKVGLASSYYSIGNIYLKQKKYNKVRWYAENAMHIGQELGSPASIKEAARLLYNINKRENKMADALKMHELYIQMKDSIQSQETRKTSLRKQFQFEYDRKAEADSIKAVEERKVTALKLEQERTQRYALYGGLTLVIIFAGFMFNRFRVTQKQKSVIVDQKNVLEIKQKEILDSIRYAKRIQQSLLPNSKFISRTLDRLNKNADKG